MKYLICFGSNGYEVVQQRLVDSADGWFDKCIQYKEEDIDTDFRTRHSQIMNCRRGYGYWMWKPYFLLKTFETMNEGDFCLYADSTAVLVSDPTALFDICAQSGGILMFSPKIYLMTTWTKADCFNMMGLTERKYLNGTVLLAAFQLYQKNERSFSFIRDYMYYCSDYQIVSDAPNIMGYNFPNFREHRHDQSILSLLAIKYEVNIRRDPSQHGNHLPDAYGQIFDLKRDIKFRRYYSNDVQYGNSNMSENPLKATVENTVFITVAAWEAWEKKTEIFRKSAENYGIPVIIRDTNKQWRGFWYHKIDVMQEYLRALTLQGKEFVFIVDSRDVAFIEPFDTILDKFNRINTGRVIFNQDIELCPKGIREKSYYTAALENATGNKCSWLNAGCLVGSISSILNLMAVATSIRQEWIDDQPQSDISQQIYQDFGQRWADNDQVLYQVSQMYRPELIQLDSNKDLFAIIRYFPDELHERCINPDNSRYDKVINDASIVHAPVPTNPPDKLNHNPENIVKWKEWTWQKKWKRDSANSI